jgi:AbrB family looped-hinge helix DNA binding protein
MESQVVSDELDKRAKWSYNVGNRVRLQQEVMVLSTRLSSKGQLVIPRSVRDALGLQVGTRFQVLVQDGKIVLEPIVKSPIDALYGKYSQVDLLGDLEAEHKREIEREASTRA